MTCARAALFVAMLGSAVALTACAEPPEKEMQQAQGALDAARAAGADEYATEEFAAAQTALDRAGDAVDLGDYRLALNHALDSRERAQNAAKLAADGKAAARVDADRALTALAAALETARARLKAAQTAKVPARTLENPQRAVADAERRLQEVRAAVERGEYRAVVAAANEVTKALAEHVTALEATAAQPTRRRR